MLNNVKFGKIKNGPIGYNSNRYRKIYNSNINFLFYKTFVRT